MTCEQSRYSTHATGKQQHVPLETPDQLIACDYTDLHNELQLPVSHYTIEFARILLNPHIAKKHPQQLSLLQVFRNQAYSLLGSIGASRIHA